MASPPPSPAEWVQEVKIVRDAGKIIIHFYFFLTKLNDLHWGVSNTSKWLTEGPIYFLSDSYMLQCDEDCPVSAEQPLLAQSQPSIPGAPCVLCLCELLWTTSSSPTSKSPSHQMCCLPSPPWTFIRLLSLQLLRQWVQVLFCFVVVLLFLNNYCVCS